MADPSLLLMALARKQAQQFNASPLSQEISREVTGAGRSIVDALMAPGNALQGQYNEVEVNPDGSVNPVNSALIAQALNMAGTISAGSGSISRPSSSLGMGGFDKWFGQSQVRNPDGSPMKLYHGTTGDFDTFRVPRDGAGNERAVYFTPDPGVASQYAAGKGSVMPAYVKADNLLTIDMKGAPTDALGRSREAIVREARQAGYDAVLLKNTGDVGGIQDQYAVFNPAQIKSAIGNSGNFDPADPNILRLSGVPIIQNDEQ